MVTCNFDFELQNGRTGAGPADRAVSRRRCPSCLAYETSILQINRNLEQPTLSLPCMPEGDLCAGRTGIRPGGSASTAVRLAKDPVRREDARNLTWDRSAAGLQPRTGIRRNGRMAVGLLRLLILLPSFSLPGMPSPGPYQWLDTISRKSP